MKHFSKNKWSQPQSLSELFLFWQMLIEVSCVIVTYPAVQVGLWVPRKGPRSPSAEITHASEIYSKTEWVKVFL